MAPAGLLCLYTETHGNNLKWHCVVKLWEIGFVTRHCKLIFFLWRERFCIVKDWHCNWFRDLSGVTKCSSWRVHLVYIGVLWLHYEMSCDNCRLNLHSEFLRSFLLWRNHTNFSTRIHLIFAFFYILTNVYHARSMMICVTTYLKLT